MIPAPSRPGPPHSPMMRGTPTRPRTCSWAQTAASPDTTQPLGMRDTSAPPATPSATLVLPATSSATHSSFLGRGWSCWAPSGSFSTSPDSRTLLGANGGIHAVIVIVLSPAAGVIADRTARRDLLIVGRVGLAVVAIGMGLVIVVGAAEVLDRARRRRLRSRLPRLTQPRQPELRVSTSWGLAVSRRPWP